VTLSNYLEARYLSLVVPGLIPHLDDFGGEHPAEGLNLKELERLLARADREPFQPEGLDGLLFSLFGNAAPVAQDLPVAAVCRLGETDAPTPQTWWLRADPIEAQPGQHSVLCLGNRHLELTQEQVAQLVNELNPLFAPEGWRLEALHPTRWYLSVPEPPSVCTVPLLEVVGRDLHLCLPTGEEAPRWHRVLNEVQMVLHACAVNQHREAQGQPPVNSLWFWGGGRLPAMGPVLWQAVWGDTPLAQGLGRLAAIPTYTRPTLAAEWLQQARGGHHLLVWHELQELMSYREWPQWRDVLNAFLQRWIEPLLISLKANEIAGLELYPGDGWVYRTTRRQWRRWWRRSRSLST
jgi:hypothetical protein